jgi:hypothetical protein
MGSEDLFHKRKAKKANNLERRKANRAPYDKVLIVCEGEKTEPNYFNELIECYKLNTANVEIDGSCGSSPISVFSRARELWEIEVNKGDPFDRVYCVFDRDTHETYDEAIENISNVKYKNIFFAAASIPSFEYWLLLHFKFTTKPYSKTGKYSIADVVLNELIDVMPTYTKGSKNIFSDLLPQLEFAKENAARSLKQACENHTDNPSTYIHKLIDYLQNLKGRK